MQSFHLVRTRHRPSLNQPPDARAVCLDLHTIQSVLHLRQSDAADILVPPPYLSPRLSSLPRIRQRQPGV